MAKYLNAPKSVSAINAGDSELKSSWKAARNHPEICFETCSIGNFKNCFASLSAFGMAPSNKEPPEVTILTDRAD